MPLQNYLMKNQKWPKQQSRIDRIIFWGIALILIFAPLAFGSVHVWAYTFIELTIFCLILLYIIDRFAISRSDSFGWIKTPVNLFIILFLGLMILQITPLPVFIVKLISPQTYADKMKIVALFNMGNGPTSFNPSWMQIAYYAHPVVIEGLKVLAYAGMFFLSVNIIQTKKQTNTIIYILIALGVFESVYAIYQVFGDDPKVWWWESRFGILGRGSGTYIGSNHFAGYMEMIIPLTFGFMISQISRPKQFLSGLGGFRAFFQRVIRWFSSESNHPKTILLFFCNVIMFLGLLLSGSRGGIIATSIALLVIACLLCLKKQYRRYWILPFLLCLITIIYGLNIGLESTVERFKHSEALTDRLAVTQSIVPMITDYPVLGVGWGNFRYLYPRYIEVYDRVSGSGYAHNDWGEAGIELGLTGVGLLIIGFGMYIFKVFQTWRQRKDLYPIGIGSGVLAGMIAIGFHSFFDFNMHIPANPLAMTVLMAIGFVTVHRYGHGYSERFIYTLQSIQLTRSRKFLIAGTIILIFGSCMLMSVRHFIAEIYCPSEWNSTLNLNWKPRISDIQKAQGYNPINAEYYYKEAVSYMKIMEQNDQLLSQYSNLTAEQLKTAVRLNPANGLYWFELGKAFSQAYNDMDNRSEKVLSSGDYCFDMAVYFSPKYTDILIGAAKYYLWRSTIFVDSDDNTTKKKENILKFQDYFLRAFELEFLKVKSKTMEKQVKIQLLDNVDLIWNFYPDEHVVLKIIPEENEKLRVEILKYVLKK